MNGIYWERFLSTGKIDDYLNYKNSEADSGSSKTDRRNNEAGTRDGRTETQMNGRKDGSESDRTDRHGAVYHAGRRI